MPIPHVLLLLLMQQPLSLPPRLGSSSLPPPPCFANQSLSSKEAADRLQTHGLGVDVRNNDPWMGVARIRMRTVYRGQKIKGGSKGMNAQRGRERCVPRLECSIISPPR
ncbi:hypothetical protein CCUS01_04588 [Colletotrichum cuscutae]|uniref:Uncharacterized protein n=1 Tax=Colletotrichum cuscutae TaxID=1209917 RepID=A0AAI9VFF6_9PEZI|nr:hypothetical protein CCUS01_04588 [Colletotrichum cuscutae]